MKREPILSLLGYDPELLGELSDAERSSLRGGSVAWLLACLILGGAAAYGAWLVQPVIASPALAGIGVTLLTVNLLRLVAAGGGSKLGETLEKGQAGCRRYRPSLTPALIFGVLAAILSQPAQLPLWPELDQEVEAHREALILQHDSARTAQSSEADYFRQELEEAGFPIFRLKLIWRDPKRVLRFTAIMCLLVLLPAFWSHVISIEAVRAYEAQRCRRTHQSIAKLKTEGDAEVDRLLAQWPSYTPVPEWAGALKHTKRGPWLRKNPS